MAHLSKMQDLSEDNLLKRHQTHSSDCDVTENDFSEEVKCFIANISGPVRAIRSYMGATDENPYMQRTHFFYEKRQDIYTDIRVQSGINDYFDLFNFDSDIDGMSYINNIDVSAAQIDGKVNDPISPALYDTTPLEWELMDSPHGSILNIHALITNQGGLVPMGYWNDDKNENACTGGKVYGNSGLKVELNDLCTDPFGCPNNYVQHRRCMFFDTPGMPVEEASNTARWIHKPPTVPHSTALELKWTHPSTTSNCSLHSPQRSLLLCRKNSLMPFFLGIIWGVKRIDLLTVLTLQV